MYHLVTGLYRHYFQKDEYFIVILGLDNAGKTTLLERIKVIYNGVKGLKPSQIGPTVGLNVGKIQLPNMQLKYLQPNKLLGSWWTDWIEIDLGEILRTVPCYCFCGRFN